MVLKVIQQEVLFLHARHLYSFNQETFIITVYMPVSAIAMKQKMES